MYFLIWALFLMYWEEKVKNNIVIIIYPSDLRWVSKILVSESFFLHVFHFFFFLLNAA